jgi:threonylcarbamoyladenosine tRNA methylthiotransferase MtaB
MGDRRPVPSVFFKSIGCRTNQEEMVVLCGNLLRKGYSIAADESEADIIIFNTCSVTAATEAKTFRLLKSIARGVPDARILVTGCLAQQYPEKLIHIPGVEWVVGNSLKNSIDTVLGGIRGVFHEDITAAAEQVLPINTEIVSPDQIPLKRTRFSLKIQEGCDFRCTYCIVPRLRGPSRCVSSREAVKVFRRAISMGYKEIILTGTHIGQYDDGDGSDLAGLLEQFTNVGGDFRIRLSSLDPRDCSDTILKFVAEHGKVAKHLHVSLQSCSEQVLSAMNRPYAGTGAIIGKLLQLRKRWPLIGIGADLIVGFPGETDMMFSETCDVVRQLELSYVHVFRYSPRPETEAAVMKAQIAEQVKTQRGNRLRSIVASSRKGFLLRNRLEKQRIIVENENPVRGVTSNFLQVEIPGCKKEHNSWLDVVLTGNVSGRYCTAEPVSEVT